MKLIDEFNEKLKALVDEDSFDWQRVIFSTPETEENIATLREKVIIPEELAAFFLKYGAFKSNAFGDAWQTVQLFSVQELLDMPLGIIDFIDYYWGGRPEFADYFSSEEITHLNQQYKIFGLKYVDDNVHDYWFFDQHGKCGNLPFDQDDCEPAMEILKELLISSNLTLSLEELLTAQFESILEEL
jgi:hypothetical protein